MAELKIVDNATCTFCGCVCDDMELTVEDHKIAKAKNACVLGKAWFLNHHIEERPVALIDGKPATLEEGIERAAQVLANARYPIVYGLSDTTCEAQRVAVAIADRVGACVDTTTSVCHGPSGVAERMKSCKFGILFFGMGLSMTRGRHLNVEAALGLARDLNQYTRFYAKPMRGHGNVTGADNVVSWQTGYPFGVHLGRGYPRFNPGEFTTADTLARGQADAALIVASDPIGNFSQPAREHLARIQYISLDPKETPTVKAAAVAITTAVYGINTAGTVYRMDDVPIPLRPAFESPYPSDEEVLKRIERRIRELQGAAA